MTATIYKIPIPEGDRPDRAGRARHATLRAGRARRQRRDRRGALLAGGRPHTDRAIRLWVVLLRVARERARRVGRLIGVGGGALYGGAGNRAGYYQIERTSRARPRRRARHLGEYTLAHKRRHAEVAVPSARNVALAALAGTPVRQRDGCPGGRSSSGATRPRGRLDVVADTASAADAGRDDLHRVRRRRSVRRDGAVDRRPGVHLRRREGRPARRGCPCLRRVAATRSSSRATAGGCGRGSRCSLATTNSPAAWCSRTASSATIDRRANQRRRHGEPRRRGVRRRRRQLVGGRSPAYPARSIRTGSRSTSISCTSDRRPCERRWSSKRWPVSRRATSTRSTSSWSAGAQRWGCGSRRVCGEAIRRTLQTMIDPIAATSTVDSGVEQGACGA